MAQIPLKHKASGQVRYLPQHYLDLHPGVYELVDETPAAETPAAETPARETKAEMRARRAAEQAAADTDTDTAPEASQADGMLTPEGQQ